MALARSGREFHQHAELLVLGHELRDTTCCFASATAPRSTAGTLGTNINIFITPSNYVAADAYQSGDELAHARRRRTR